MIGDQTQKPFSVDKGRQAAIVVFVIFVGIEALVLLGYLVRVGPDKLVQHAVRLGIAALLGWALIRRYSWARWVMLALLGLGFLSSTSAIIGLWRSGQTTALAVIALLWTGYLVMGGILLLSRDLRGYLSSDRSS